jgi:FkbM family methyltransferase
MNPQSIKAILPLRMRVMLRGAYNSLWASRHYNSWPFGFFWSLFHREYHTEGMKFRLPFSMMPMGFRSRFLFDAYEAGERQLCKKYLSNKDTVLELGACLGIVSCVCNKILSPYETARHVVVEANPKLIPWIEKNRTQNHCSFAIEHGMLSKSSNGDFRIEQFIVSGSAHTTTGHLIKVPVFTLDDICEKYAFTPNTIVMDIEGGEIDFLVENVDWIRHNSYFTKLIVEIHPFIVGDSAVEQFHAQLQKLGFVNVESVGSVEAWDRQ